MKIKLHLKKYFFGCTIIFSSPHEKKILNPPLQDPTFFINFYGNGRENTLLLGTRSRRSLYALFNPFKTSNFFFPYLNNTNRKSISQVRRLLKPLIA
jgi:hypothetical protein